MIYDTNDSLYALKITDAVFLLAIVVCAFLFVDANNVNGEVPSSDKCLTQYRNYLNSFGCISYTVKSGNQVTKVSYNGPYYHAIDTNQEDPDYVLELNWDICLCTLTSDPDSLEDPLSILTYRDPMKETRTIYEVMAMSELLGVIPFGDEFGSYVILDILKGIQTVTSKEHKNGVELIVISGTNTKTHLNVQAWFDPNHKYALCGLSINRIGEIKPGDITSYSFFFDKFIEVNSIPLPTESRWVLKQNHPDTGKDHIDEGTTHFSGYSISDNTNPQPFSFITKIPNGTKVIAKDARHIDHVWLDGKVVPWTDEVMYAIATEGHEFKPGYSEPRFWMITISIVLFALAFAKLIYDYCKNKK